MKSILLVCLLGMASMAHTQKLEVTSRLKFLALGDSYTIGQGVAKTESWPYQFKVYLETKGVKFDTLAVIAQTGWTTGNLKAALQNTNTAGKFNLVSLLIGVNNQYQGQNKDVYIKEFEELLIKSIEIAGRSQNVFVLSIPDYGYTPFGKANQAQISAEIDEYNAINRNITQKYQVAYFDITPISRTGLQNTNLVAYDGLHPSAEMYALWVQLIGKFISVKEVVSTTNSISALPERMFSITATSNSVRFQLNNTLGQVPAKLSIFSILGHKLHETIIYKNVEIGLKKGVMYIYRLHTPTGLFSGKFAIY
jgi:lysophospholipase L1-like esterase